MPAAWCPVGPTAISRRMRRWRTRPADAAHPRHLGAARWPGMLVRTCAKRVRVLPHGLRAVPWGAWLRHKSRSVSPRTTTHAGAPTTRALVVGRADPADPVHGVREAEAREPEAPRSLI